MKKVVWTSGTKLKSAKNGKTYTVRCPVFEGNEWVYVNESTKQLEIAVHKFTVVE